MRSEDIPQVLSRPGRMLVCGSGVTGMALVRALCLRGLEVLLLDERALRPEVIAEAESLGATTLGSFRESHVEQIRGSKCAVLSPGIPLNASLVQILRGAAVPLLSEIDLALPFIGMPLVAVTGTNGKSTTTALVGEMLRRSGIEAETAGNIGKPLTLLAGDLREERQVPYVAELSSFQLEGTNSLAPKVSVWLNLAEHHLDRHKTFAEYLAAKARIFSGQSGSSSYAILNRDDPRFDEMTPHVRSKLIRFGLSRHGDSADGCFYDAVRDEALLRIEGMEERFVLRETKLLGRHNRLNLTAALAAARLAGATVAGISAAISEFKALEHRLELVKSGDGVRYVNDSKATTVAAAVTGFDALRESFPDSMLIALIGGRSDHGSWERLRERLDGQVRSVIGFGEDGEKILSEFGAQGTHLEYRPNFADAVRRARSLALPGDVVVLLPGCVSYDAFRNFEERGREFKRIIEEN